MTARFHARKYRPLQLFVALCLLVYVTAFTKGRFVLERRRDAPSGVQHRVIKEIVDDTLDNFTLGMTPSKNTLGDIAPRILEIQDYLACMIQKADWQTTPHDPYLVLNTDCQLPELSRVNMPSMNGDICNLTSGKKLLLVGPETTYYLHTLWLQALEARENQTHECPGRNFCTFHHICFQNGSTPPILEGPTSRKKKMPSESFLKETKSALMQYTHSSTLFASPSRLHSGYQLPVVDEETGVKRSENFWRTRAQKSDIVVFHRPPESAHASSYSDLNIAGNWTFASNACRKSEPQPNSLCGRSLGYDITLAALDVTLRRFLPAVLQTLEQIAADTTLRNTRLIWQGSWYIQASCSRIGLPKSIPLIEGFWFNAGAAETAMDPWTLYYNAQVYMHHRVLPMVLPYFNVTYLPLTFPMFDETTDVYIDGEHETPSPANPKDCIRHPWTRFGVDLQQTFLGGLATLLRLHENEY